MGIISIIKTIKGNTLRIENLLRLLHPSSPADRTCKVRSEDGVKTNSLPGHLRIHHPGKRCHRSLLATEGKSEPKPTIKFAKHAPDLSNFQFCSASADGRVSNQRERPFFAKVGHIGKWECFLFQKPRRALRLSI